MNIQVEELEFDEVITDDDYCDEYLNLPEDYALTQADYRAHNEAHRRFLSTLAGDGFAMLYGAEA